MSDGIVRRKDSFPEKLGAKRWFYLRFAVSFVVATVVATSLVTNTGLAFVAALVGAVVLAALVQLAARALGLRPPKLDLERREPDIRIPGTVPPPGPPAPTRSTRRQVRVRPDVDGRADGR